MARIKRAILSVTDKTGIVDLGRALQEMEVEILSTGGTARELRLAGLNVVSVQDYTGVPEMFEGRVKTLHHRIHGGILFRRDNGLDAYEAAQNGILPIDLVAVNLYPFEKTAAKPGVSLAELIENMDIGGPTMLMAGVKNHQDVAVVTEPSMYKAIIRELRERGGELSPETHRMLAAIAINRVADYRSANAVVLGQHLSGEETVRLTGRKGKKLGRYGENWHQKAWIFMTPGVQEPNFVNSEQLHGPELGYNNYIDATAALQTVLEYNEPCAVVVKHTNPCGTATGDTLEIALERAWQGDSEAAFGSIIALNREVDLDTIKVLGERKNPEGKTGWMVDVIVAPSFSQEALDYIKGKPGKKNLRVIAVGPLDKPQEAFDYRFVRGGILKQTRDDRLYLTASIDDLFAPQFKLTCDNSGKELTVGVVTEAMPDASLKGCYEFAWKAVKHVKSNAIIIAREYAPGRYQALGMGAGQPSRVKSAELAVDQATKNLLNEFAMLQNAERYEHYPILAAEIEKLRGTFRPDMKFADYKQEQLARCVAASDAFFPFTDGPEKLAEFGIRNFIQPGGGAKDADVIATINQYKGAMIFTGTRHFLH